MNRIIILIAAILSLSAAYAQKGVDISELSLTENLEQPEVVGKAQKPVVAHMRGIYNTLAKHFGNVEMLRDGQVVMVTIPASTLFAPNSTELLESGKPYLRPFLNMLKYPTMYKVLLAMHADDSGDDQYADALTENRADAVADFLNHEAGSHAANLVAYGMGKEDPIGPNSSIEARAANRRLELYIVPQWQLIEQAKAGKLK